MIFILFAFVVYVFETNFVEWGKVRGKAESLVIPACQPDFYDEPQWKCFYFTFLVFATTAANATESSYACYYDDVRNTYLGDVYSVMWMENADQVTKTKLLHFDTRAYRRPHSKNFWIRYKLPQTALRVRDWGLFKRRLGLSALDYDS